MSDEPNLRDQRFPFEYADIVKLINMLDAYNCMDWERFWIDAEDDKICFDVVDSDLFAWGYAGSIPLAPSEIDDLEDAIKDCHEVDDCCTWEPFSLWCCRKMQERPQGAHYPKDKTFWPLFDACGPEREVRPGNPYAPGDYTDFHDQERRQHFNTLIDEWDGQRKYASSLWSQHTTDCPAYLKIIAMGQPAVPLILEKLAAWHDQDGSSYLMTAIHALALYPPPSFPAGRIKEGVDAWVAWGKTYYPDL